MSGPITWRNVQGASPAEASRPLVYAGQAFNDSFGVLNNVLKQHQDTQTANTAVLEENAKQAFLERLNSARTPEELAAMQPDIQAMRAGLSPRVQAATLGADEKRLASLRQQVTAGQQYTDSQAEIAARPLLAQHAELLAAGKFGEAAALRASSDIPNEGKLAMEQQEQQRKAQEFQFRVNQDVRSQNQDKRAGETHEGNKVSEELRNRLTKAQLGETEARAIDAQTTRELQTELGTVASRYQAEKGKQRTAAAAEAKALGLPLYSDGSVNTSALNADQRTQFDTVLKTKGIGTLDALESGDTAAMQQHLANLRASGKYTPAQIAAVETAAAKAFDSTTPASVGIDKETKDAARAAQAELDERNTRQYGTYNTPAEIDNLLKSVEPIVSDYADKGSDRHRSYMKQIAEFIDKGGIKVGSQRILPNEAALRGMLRQINRDDFGGNIARKFTFGLVNTGVDNDLSSVFEEWAKDPENRKGAEGAAAALNRKGLLKSIKPVDK